jgi:hypothetical protein
MALSTNLLDAPAGDACFRSDVSCHCTYSSAKNGDRLASRYICRIKAPSQPSAIATSLIDNVILIGNGVSTPTYPMHQQKHDCEDTD